VKTPPSIPNKPQKSHIYATYSPKRSPKFKTYSNLGHAKNAMQYAGNQFYRDMILYVLEGDEWVPKVVIEPITQCEVCKGKNEHLESSRYFRGYATVHYHVKPNFLTVFACDFCAKSIRSGARPTPDPHDLSEFLVDPTFQW
jgi:hypothetical protein